MSERFLSNETRIIELYKNCRTPFVLNAKPGDKIHLVTDTRQDPLVWQALAAAAREQGCVVTVSIMTPRAHHGEGPPPVVAAAMKKADINFYCASTAVYHSVEARDARAAGACTMLMDEVNVENLTSGAATMTADQYRSLNRFGEEIRKRILAGTDVHVTSEFGTDITFKIRDPKTGKVQSREGHSGIMPTRPSGTAFPDGENNTTPIEGTGEGTVVWDTSFHIVRGLLKDPVRLTVHKGRVTKIEGGAEAKQLQDFINKYGNMSECKCPDELAIGTNPMQSFTGIMRTDKKVLGGSHIAMDGGGYIHIDGIMRAPTIIIDEKPLVKNGVIQVGNGRPEI
jgi:2,5-dihydroxypyridine 5,6-dioxygenase